MVLNWGQMLSNNTKFLLSINASGLLNYETLPSNLPQKLKLCERWVTWFWPNLFSVSLSGLILSHTMVHIPFYKPTKYFRYFFWGGEEKLKREDWIFNTYICFLLIFGHKNGPNEHILCNLHWIFFSWQNQYLILTTVIDEVFKS